MPDTIHKESITTVEPEKPMSTENVQPLLSEVFMLSDYPDMNEVSFFEVSNQSFLDTELGDLKDNSILTIETSDIMDLGPLGFMLYTSKGIPNNPYAGFDSDTEEEILGRYVFSVIDEKKIKLPGIEDVSGKMICCVKDNLSGKYILARIPLDQISRVCPEMVESDDKKDQLITEVRANYIKLSSDNELTVFENNQLHLETYRGIYRLWDYCAEKGEMEEIYDLMGDLVGVHTLDSSLGEMQEFVSNKGYWNEAKAAVELWNAKGLVDTINIYLDTLDSAEQDKFRDVADILVSLTSQVITYKPKTFWEIVKPAVKKLQEKEADPDTIMSVLNHMILVNRINEIDEVKALLGPNEDIEEIGE